MLPVKDFTLIVLEGGDGGGGRISKSFAWKFLILKWVVCLPQREALTYFALSTLFLNKVLLCTLKFPPQILLRLIL